MENPHRLYEDKGLDVIELKSGQMTEVQTMCKQRRKCVAKQ